MTERQNSPGWATYLRVSDEDKQSPERSFAMQRKSIKDQLLSPSEYHFKREYCDILTGTSSNRADYQQMLVDAKAGKFSHLGLYRADRFGRDAVEGLQAATKLISMGIKIRVSNMPSLTPEEPDGFFMFLLQMGLAQREVDVLKLRTAGGMEAKMRAGGWPGKAPEGYINKERLIRSGKYDRWVELEPERGQALREAWDLLLTDRYTLAKICEELTRRGYTRSGERPWAWNDPKTGRRKYATNRLHSIFHNPFYAGWVRSERFNIVKGEVRGNWEPIVTDREFERGVKILHKNDAYKSREIKHFYMLRALLWVQQSGETFKMYGSTPSGRYKSYSYYITHAKPGGSAIRIACDMVDDQIPDWLKSIHIAEEKLPGIRDVYKAQIRETVDEDHEKKLSELKRRMKRLQEEEAKLGRLYITNNIGEDTYQQLRSEWQEKTRHTEANLRDMARNVAAYLDDLNIALILMTKISFFSTVWI